jgi:hypothetical protein
MLAFTCTDFKKNGGLLPKCCGKWLKISGMTDTIGLKRSGKLMT